MTQFYWMMALMQAQWDESGMTWDIYTDKVRNELAYQLTTKQLDHIFSTHDMFR